MLETIQAALIRKNFAVVSKTVISTKDCEYHVPAEQAQVRQLFVHLKGRAAFITINETTDDRHRTTPHYSLEFHFGYLPITDLLKMCFNQDKFDKSFQSFDDRADYHDHVVPGYNTDFALPAPFQRFGSSSGPLEKGKEYEYEFHTESHTEVTIDQIVSLIDDVITQVDPYLAREFHPDSSLGVCFAPEYQFKGCGPIFSEQFDWSYFRMLFRQRQSRGKRLR